MNGACGDTGGMALLYPAARCSVPSPVLGASLDGRIPESRTRGNPFPPFRKKRTEHQAIRVRARNRKIMPASTSFLPSSNAFPSCLLTEVKSSTLV
jgi:hypothetical protein